MKRRVFLKSAIATGSVFAVSGVVANNVMGNVFSSDNYSPTEVKKILTEHYNKIFSGDNLDVNLLPNPGKLTFAESFDIEMTSKKVNIFDIAETVIEMTKTINFDASSLRDGKIPDDMEVFKGYVSVKTNGSYTALKLNELKNFDAQIIINNPIVIKYNVPVIEWIDIKDFELNTSNDKVVSYVDNKNKIRVFIFKEPIYSTLTINNINPLIINKNEPKEITALDKNLLCNFSINLNIQ